jgi:hypothetical protein
MNRIEAINAVHEVNAAALALVNLTVENIKNSTTTQAVVNRKNGQGTSIAVVSSAAISKKKSQTELEEKIKEVVNKLDDINEPKIKRPLLEFYDSLQRISPSKNSNN